MKRILCFSLALIAVPPIAPIEGLTSSTNIHKDFNQRRTDSSIHGRVAGVAIGTAADGGGHDGFDSAGAGHDRKTREARGARVAHLDGYVPPEQQAELEQILLHSGFELATEGDLSRSRDKTVESSSVTTSKIFRYKFIKASGMLKLINHAESNEVEENDIIPKYIPVFRGEENVLVANGWSFLDPDESEPLSPFEVDAANEEGQYRPKWGDTNTNNPSNDDDDRNSSLRSFMTSLKLSSLGYNLQRLSTEEIMKAAHSETVSMQAKKVLLEGSTDPPHAKLTNNGYDFSAKSLQFNSSDKSPPVGIFACAIGSLPLFSTADLFPANLLASQGWLSFVKPIADDHIVLVYPDTRDLDQRIEVLDARTGCHLGHYFGKDGFCINASALNFVPLDGSKMSGENHLDVSLSPHSWLPWSNDHVVVQERATIAESTQLTASQQILKKTMYANTSCKEIIFGAGCFWHVEFALRRIPGIIGTVVGYAGGNISNPTYKDVCSGSTGHAEVVQVTYDPYICDTRKLIDCWLAMHDPTMVRAHGKRSLNGQYRSCLFLVDEEMEPIAHDAATSCQKQLGKMLSSEVRMISKDDFWVAEGRHQRHDERRKESAVETNTLSFEEWLLKYGRRSDSMWGSSEILQQNFVRDDSEDDGMARLMI